MDWLASLRAVKIWQNLTHYNSYFAKPDIIAFVKL